MEVTGGGAGGKKSRKNLTLDELEALQVRYETRKLSIGDFVWIAKSSLRPGKSAVYIWSLVITYPVNVTKCLPGDDLVLPYVVERKRMDDLRSSIMDGRYKEQKTRLANCGVPKKFYLIEETASTKGREAWQGHANQVGYQ